MVLGLWNKPPPPPILHVRRGHLAHAQSQQQQRHQQQQQHQQHQQQRNGAAVLLPPQEGDLRKTLVLDLDRTLIDCIVLRDPSISEPDFVYMDDLGTQAKVWTRPFLRQFLSAVARDFEVVLFTAAGARHADSVLQVIDPRRQIFSHRLYGQHTTEASQWGWVKDLSRLGRPLSSTLLVDDSQLAGLLQPCSLVPIRPFVHSNPKKDWDTALSELLRFLQDKVLPAADVRHAIALHWNKVTRRARRRPLQPSWSLSPSTPPSCGCSCHVTHHASLPPSTHLGGAWTHAPAQAGGAVHAAMPVHVDAGPTPAPVGWQRCLAADQGCGCNYAAGDHAVVAAAAAFDMQACYADEDEEEEEGGHDDLMGPGGGCGCCRGSSNAFAQEPETASKGLRRSPKTLHQLSAGGGAPPLDHNATGELDRTSRGLDRTSRGLDRTSRGPGDRTSACFDEAEVAALLAGAPATPTKVDSGLLTAGDPLTDVGTLPVMTQWLTSAIEADAVPGGIMSQEGEGFLLVVQQQTTVSLELPLQLGGLQPPPLQLGLRAASQQPLQLGACAALPQPQARSMSCSTDETTALDVLMPACTADLLGSSGSGTPWYEADPGEGGSILGAGHNEPEGIATQLLRHLEASGPGPTVMWSSVGDAAQPVELCAHALAQHRTAWSEGRRGVGHAQQGRGSSIESWSSEGGFYSADGLDGVWQAGQPALGVNLSLEGLPEGMQGSGAALAGVDTEGSGPVKQSNGQTLTVKQLLAGHLSQGLPVAV